MMGEIKYSDELRQKNKDLTLILLYLNSWKERGFDSLRSWKGYDFGALNELSEEGYISEGRRSKSVVLFEEGIEKAKSLLAEYGIEFEEAAK